MEDGKRIIGLTENTAEVAQKMSLSIRRRDRDIGRLEKLRLVLSKLYRIDELLEALEVIKKGNSHPSQLEKQCSLLRELRMIADPNACVAWNARSQGGISLSDKISSIQVGVQRDLGVIIHQLGGDAEGSIDTILTKAFDLLVLLDAIGCLEGGLEAINQLIAPMADRVLGNLINSSASMDYRYAIRMSKCIEYTNGLMGWCRQRSSLLSLSRPEQVNQSIGRTLDRITINAINIVIKAFQFERLRAPGTPTVEKAFEDTMHVGNSFIPPLPAVVPTTGAEGKDGVNIRDLDLSVAELTLIIQQAINFIFFPNNNYGDLHLLLKEELIPMYRYLESNYLSLGIKKVP